MKKKVGSSASSGLSASGALNVWTMFSHCILTGKRVSYIKVAIRRCEDRESTPRKNRGHVKTHSKGTCNSKRSRSSRPKRHIHNTDRQSCSTGHKDRVSTYPASCGALLGAKAVFPLHGARCTELQPHRGTLWSCGGPCSYQGSCRCRWRSGTPGVLRSSGL